jgi:type IV fimbrial biogenesis protein FimT
MREKANMDFFTFSSLRFIHKEKSKPLRMHKGLSFIELILVMVIVAILAAIAIPHFLAQTQQHRLVTNIEGLYYNLQFARSEALKQNRSVYVSFQTGSAWCYGLNAGSACNCNNPSSCSLGSYTPTASLTTLSLSGLNNIVFESSRGTANAAGTITLTVSGGTLSVGIDVGNLGNLQLCSNTISGYPTC